MIEIPYAASLSDPMMKNHEFLSFGTNNLTQRTFDLSHDEIGGLRKR